LSLRTAGSTAEAITTASRTKSSKCLIKNKSQRNPAQKTMRKIVAEAAKNDYRMSSIILGIVNSIPFRMREAL